MSTAVGQTHVLLTVFMATLSGLDSPLSLIAQQHAALPFAWRMPGFQNEKLSKSGEVGPNARVQRWCIPANSEGYIGNDMEKVERAGANYSGFPNRCRKKILLNQNVAPYVTPGQIVPIAGN